MVGVKVPFSRCGQTRCIYSKSLSYQRLVSYVEIREQGVDIIFG